MASRRLELLSDLCDRTEAALVKDLPAVGDDLLTFQEQAVQRQKIVEELRAIEEVPTPQELELITRLAGLTTRLETHFDNMRTDVGQALRAQRTQRGQTRSYGSQDVQAVVISQEA